MGKHAYLIIAHNNFYILEKMLRMIDDARNDIYLHIDKKTKNFNFEYFKSVIKVSNIFFVDRIRVMWGGYSQISSELSLMEAALKGNYDYYHLISGVDMLIKSQDYIHKFCDNNYGKEFIEMTKVNATNEWWKSVENRVQNYHFFYDLVNWRSKNIGVKVIKAINTILLLVQNKLNLCRYNEEFWYGANWCSLTHKCIDYIVKNKNEINRMYKFTLCSDELYKQTLIAKNEEIYSNVYDIENSKNSYMRYIDWKRGNPYIFTRCDYENIINSEAFFARKFDVEKDKEIIDMIYKEVCK